MTAPLPRSGRPAGGARVDGDRVRELRARDPEFWTIPRLAAYFGCNGSTIHYHLRRRGAGDRQEG